MKKLLLLALIVSTSFASAQVLETENFTLLATGDIGISIDGETPGQGGYFTFASANAGTTTNAGNSNFQVSLTLSTYGNVLTLTGANGDNGDRYMWKGGLEDAWNLRTAGNNLFVTTVDVKTSVRGESENSFGVSVYSADYKVLVGFSIDSQTGQLYLAAYSGGVGDEGNYLYPLSTEELPDGVFLPENTWTTIQTGFDYDTGDVFIAFNDTVLGLTGSAALNAPSEVDFESYSGSENNTVATSMLFDNLFVEAFSNALAVKKSELVAGVKVYPNPTTDILNVTLENKAINAISITDLNGRIVKKQSFNNISNISMNVSDLAAGVYMMNIASDKGTTTKKIIKN